MVSPRRPGANARTRRRPRHARGPKNGQLACPGQREVRAFFSDVANQSGAQNSSKLSRLITQSNRDKLFTFLRRRWPLALVSVGLLLLAYVGFQYLSMWQEQHAFAEEWSRQAGTNPAAPVEVNGQSGVARLIIPRLDLQEIVVQGTSYKALKAGPGHLVQTPLPGDPGNSVLAGHRDTFFRKLNDLNLGDSVVVERGGRTYHFVIIGRKIVDPGDVSVLKPSPEPTLTLITCYPPHFIGPAPKRLVLTSELAGSQKSEVRSQK